MATLLYDGDCGFCTWTAQWLQRRAVSAAVVHPWQAADLDRIGVSEQACRDAVQWADGDRRSSGPVALADYLRTSTAGWRLIGRLVGSRAALVVGWPVYRLVSRYRGRLPGSTPACDPPGSATAGAAGHPDSS